MIMTGSCVMFLCVRNLCLQIIRLICRKRSISTAFTASINPTEWYSTTRSAPCSRAAIDADDHVSLHYKCAIIGYLPLPIILAGGHARVWRLRIDLRCANYRTSSIIPQFQYRTPIEIAPALGNGNKVRIFCTNLLAASPEWINNITHTREYTHKKRDPHYGRPGRICMHAAL